MMGEGGNERYRGRRVKCDACSDKLSARSLKSHLASQHDIHSNVALSTDLLDEDRPPRTYRAEHLFEDGLFWYPVLNCKGNAPTKYGLRRHFACSHPQDFVDILGEGCLTKCGRCGMQVNPSASGHRETDTTDEAGPGAAEDRLDGRQSTRREVHHVRGTVGKCNCV